MQPRNYIYSSELLKKKIWKYELLHVNFVDDFKFSMALNCGTEISWLTSPYRCGLYRYRHHEGIDGAHDLSNVSNTDRINWVSSQNYEISINSLLCISVINL
jgi:hypothetical protein